MGVREAPLKLAAPLFGHDTWGAPLIVCGLVRFPDPLVKRVGEPDKVTLSIEVTSVKNILLDGREEGVSF